MTEKQWQQLLDVVEGKTVSQMPVGFIIDSPWLPNWAEMSILDYYADERRWLDANLKAVRRFPDIIFLPGFWSEYGMCTEPSAFGAKCSWPEDEFPFAHKILEDISEAAALQKPDPAVDGLLPFVIKRMQHCEAEIKAEGHEFRFAVARGPLNVASFLFGNTELMMAMMTQPDETHKLLETVTDFLVDWLRLQAECFQTIDGVLLLDDIIGFLGDEQFTQFAMPYLKRAFGAVDASVKFLHNDAQGMVTARHLNEVGVNLFNFSFEHSLADIKAATGGTVALVGNIPPRDVLAGGTPEQVSAAVKSSLRSVDDTTRILLSCGGGMPPGVPTENIEAFCEAAQEV